MSDINQVRTAAHQRFIDEWLDPLDITKPRTLFALGDETFDPPGGIDAYGEPWARLSMKHMDAAQRTLAPVGHRKFKREAIVFLQLFVPPNSGEAVQDVLLKAGQRLYEGRKLSLDDVVIKEVVVRELGEIEDGRWNASTIQATIEYDEVK